MGLYGTSKAAEMGLVNRVVEPGELLDASLTVAREIAALPEGLAEAAKRGFVLAVALDERGQCRHRVRNRLVMNGPRGFHHDQRILVVQKCRDFGRLFASQGNHGS